MVSSCNGFSLFRVSALVQAEEEQEWSSVALRQTHPLAGQRSVGCLLYMISIVAELGGSIVLWPTLNTQQHWACFWGRVKCRYPAGAFETPLLSNLAKAKWEAVWNCRRCIKILEQALMSDSLWVKGKSYSRGIFFFPCKGTSGWLFCSELDAWYYFVVAWTVLNTVPDLYSIVYMLIEKPLSRTLCKHISTRYYCLDTWANICLKNVIDYCSITATCPLVFWHSCRRDYAYSIAFSQHFNGSQLSTNN